MGYKNERRALLLVEPKQQLNNLRARRRIKVTRGLIRKHNKWLCSKSTSDSDALLLST